MTIKVTRQQVALKKWTWSVTCTSCDGAEMGGLISLMYPWMRCQGWADAQVIALWHKHLHDQRRCGTCDHEPALPKPELVKDRLFSWEGTLHQIVNGRVCEMHPTEGAA